MPPLLADELLLLAYHPDGEVHGGGVELDCAIAGAVLVELVLGGTVTSSETRIDPVTPAPRPAHPELLAARDEIGRRPPRSPQWWVLRFVREGLRRRRLDALVADGVLGQEEHRSFGGLITRLSFPEFDARPRTDAERRLHAAVTPGTDPDLRTAALGALIHAAQQGEHVFGPAYTDDTARRLAELAAANWATPAVRAAVRAVYTGLLTATLGTGLAAPRAE